MNTVLSSYNGLTLLVLLVVVLLVILFSLNGYSVHRRYAVLRNGRSVSRHYTRAKAQRVRDQITEETETTDLYSVAVIRR